MRPDCRFTATSHISRQKYGRLSVVASLASWRFNEGITAKSAKNNRKEREDNRKGRKGREDNRKGRKEREDNRAFRVFPWLKNLK